MGLVTTCYSCDAEIVFAAGENTVKCRYCGRTNARPKSEKKELDRMKYCNQRLSFGEFDEAAEGYREVLQRTPDEHEASWGLLLCKYGVRYVEDTKTGQRLPTCRRALPTSFCAEPDFKLACEAAPPAVRAEYEKDGRYIDEIQKEIRRLKATGEKYDIFLCYKETDENGERTYDSMRAQDIYSTLQQHGFNVFYAPFSLRDCIGVNYEATIYCALETARVMLVLATKPEYFETTWVKSEWMRFLKRKNAGEKKDIFPLYEGFPPSLLPKEFTDSFFQSLNMTPLSFMSDLELNLNRILKGNETTSGNNPVLNNLLEGGFLDLEDGDFAAAQKQFEKALDVDVKCARANLGMAMVQLQARTEVMLVEICVRRSDWAEEKYVRRTERFADEHIKALLADVRSACEKAEAERKAAEERARMEAERKAAEERARMEAERKAAEEAARKELHTKCYLCHTEIMFAAGENLVKCRCCQRTNARPKSLKNEMDRMKYANERLSFGEFDEAETGYREVLQRTPDEHEARWGLLLCKYGVRYVEDTMTGQCLPTCSRALPTSFCAEPDFKLACEAAPPAVKAEYERDGRYIDDIQKEIRRLRASGVKYDIFLCYKETDENGRRTRDSMLAQNLYHTLTLHGFDVFYAPISLKNCRGANEEAAIYVALETSKVMLVLATKPEYLQTTWVKSEWLRYFERMDDGEDKILIPLYRDFTPDRLPREFNDHFLQGLDMGNFGFLFDLENFLKRQLKRPEDEPARKELLTRCCFCNVEIVFAVGEDIVRCEYCGRTNSRPKS